MRVWAFVFTICLSGCASHSADPGEDPVRQYLRLAVALGERDADSLDYYYGPSDWVSGVRANPPPLRQIKQSAASLIERLKTPSMGAVNATQTEFLTKQLRAIAARADLLMGTRRTFDEEAEVFFGIMPQQPFTSERLADVRDKIGRLLPGPAPLATRYAEFDQEFTIPAERLPAVFDRALQACRERTLAHIPLPPGEHVRVEYVSNKPWNAYSHYLGNFQSLIEVNADFAVTVDRVLELACHEGYPGHHVYNSIQDAEHVQRERRLELLAQLTFSPQSIISEAAATIAGDVAFPDAARLAFERDELFPLAGLDNSLAERYLRIQHLVDELEGAEVPIARDYLDGKLEFVRAGAALEREVLMAHPEATLKYINEYRTYMLAYTLGRRLTKACVIERAGHKETNEDPWSSYRQLILSKVSLEDCASHHLPIDIARTKP